MNIHEIEGTIPVTLVIGGNETRVSANLEIEYGDMKLYISSRIVSDLRNKIIAGEISHFELVATPKPVDESTGV